MSELVSEEAKIIALACCDFQWNLSEPDQESQLLDLIDCINENLPEFSAAGYFSLGKSTIMNIAATILNFIIFVIQLNFETTP